MSLMPEGVRIYYGENLKKKLWVEEKAKNIFEKNGFKYIELPTYEYYHDIKNNFSGDIRNNMFKFQDRDSGKVLTLRPDMTSILSKLIRLRSNDIRFPERIYYIGDVFRYEKIKSGVYREICQAGIELIGGDTNKADIEAIIIAIEALKDMGIEKPKLEIGDIRIFNALMDGYDIPEDEIEYVKHLISKKDIPTLTQVIEEKNYEKDLVKLPMLIGDKSILDELGFIDCELKEVLDTLDDLGYSENYILDLSLHHEIEYYTGIVFNGFGLESGDYILNGGRYDNLMGLPAVGFVINVDAIVDATDSIPVEPKNGYYIIGKDFSKMLKLKKKYIEDGARAEVCVEEETYQESLSYAASRNYEFLVNSDSDETVKVSGDDVNV